MDELCEYKEVERKKLILSMIITGSVMVVEVVGGLMANSLALLGDAGHMFTHFFALLISLVAIAIASKRPCHHRTFGFFRAEIIAALFNSIIIFGVSAYIFYEGIVRLFFEPAHVLAFEMLLVAIIGLIVNIITIFILHGSARTDMNIKGAYIHMIGDTGSSVAIIIGAIIVIFTGWNFLDSLIAMGIAVVIFVWAAKLCKDSINILMESTPKGIFIDEVSKELKENIPEIKEIYDIHIWVITSQMNSFTAHLSLNDDDYKNHGEILQKIKAFLKEKYGIYHSTIEFDQ